jgi:hypothetical protein
MQRYISPTRLQVIEVKRPSLARRAEIPPYPSENCSKGVKPLGRKTRGLIDFRVHHSMAMTAGNSSSFHEDCTKLQALL